MHAALLLSYLALFYGTYYISQRYKGNPYIWTAMGVTGIFGFIICLLYFRRKPVLTAKPNLVPLGFRSKKAWKMAIAAVTYTVFLFITSAAYLAQPSGNNLKAKAPGGSKGEVVSSITPADKPSSTPEIIVTPAATAAPTDVSAPTPSPAKAAASAPTAGNQAVNPTNAAGSNTNNGSVSGQLKVHYIDVGQADSILIQQGGKNMLIDAGNNADANTVINYLKNNGVSKLDVVVATHPHEDHIGAMDEVVKTFDIGTIYASSGTTTTQTYANFINAVKNKGMKLTKAVPGTKFNLGGTQCIILAPNSTSYEDLNNYSVVVKLTYGSNKFIFQGDAEAISEDEILNKGYDITADVIKIGHHGSSSSSTEKYIKRVNPKYAVISVGKDNDYGHPHQETMTLLKNLGIKVYRTDESGTIVCTSNGSNISFNTSPGSYSYRGGGSGSGSTPSSTPKPTAAPTPKPTTAPTQPPASTSVSASIDNPMPEQYATIHLTVKGPSGSAVTAVCHYKSKNTTYSGTIGSDGKDIIPIDISRASIGYKVIIDVTVKYAGKNYTAQTSFTPQ